MGLETKFQSRPDIFKRITDQVARLCYRCWRDNEGYHISRLANNAVTMESDLNIAQEQIELVIMNVMKCGYIKHVGLIIFPIKNRKKKHILSLVALHAVSPDVYTWWFISSSFLYYS